MSNWTHSICGPCWMAQNPGRGPVRMQLPETETCCFCGHPTGAGIYVRHDSETLQCGGEHE